MSTGRLPRNNLTQPEPRRLLTVHFFAMRRAEVGISMKQVFRERECIHRQEGAEGEFYNGVFYVQALQRLPVDHAMELARKVTSFFWADAPWILVWLCPACAAEIHLGDSPRAITQPVRRQA